MVPRYIVPALIVVLAITNTLASRGARITVYPDRVTGKISPMLYGQFLEHIYSSVVGGLWSEMVHDRSFEMVPQGQVNADIESVLGSWVAANGELSNETSDTPGITAFGSLDWIDYDYTFEFQKEGGAEGILIPFRYTDRNNFYWWNIGGWGNTKSAVERSINGQKIVIKEFADFGKTVAPGKWYKVKISCRGGQFSFYLDGVQAGQVQDTRHTKGKVGIGIFATRVRTRNLRVTAPDGSLLIAPNISSMRTNGLSAAWKTEKSSKSVYLGLGSEPLNGNRSCEIDARKAAAGSWASISQGVVTKQGLKYSGSVWIKSLPGMSAQVMLQTSAGNSVVKLPILSSKWTEYPFTLTAKQSSADAMITLRINGNSRCWVDQFSLMPQEAAKGLPVRADLYQRIKALQPAFIRWPGGCFAEYYRWKDGIGPQHKRVTKPNYMWGGQDPNGFGTDEYIQLCKSLGAEPVICFNIGHHDSPEMQTRYIKEAMDWIEYCNGSASSPYGKLRAANGHPKPYGVKYWEIGNETWPMGEAKYSAAVNAFKNAIRAKYANLRLFTCGSAGLAVDWNRTLAKSVIEPFGVLSCHTYWGGTWSQQMAYADDYVAGLLKSLQELRQNGHPQAKLGLTEWNNGSSDMAGALSGASFLANSEQAGEQVALACPALWLRNVDAPAWNNALINFDKQSSFVSPLYWVCQSFRKAFAPELIESRYDCSAFEENGRSYGVLSVVATKESATRRIVLKVVNRSDRADELTTISGLTNVSTLKITTIASDSVQAVNSLQQPKRVAPVNNQIHITRGEFKYRFPKHSITIFEGISSK